MIAEDYHKLITEIVDIDTEVSSIADSRRLLGEIDDGETLLLKLKESIVCDIRSAESNFLIEKATLRNKYSMNQKTGITGMIRGSPKSKLINELKRLESRSNKNIEGLKELRYTIDDLLAQFNDMKEPVNKYMKDRFSN